MRALITGVKGFTGRYVAAELESRGWEVWGIGAHEEAGDARYRCVDLADKDGLRSVLSEIRPDAVVHLAAIAFVDHGDTDALYRVNLIGSRNLLMAIEASDCRPGCVVLASSANIYGNAAEGIFAETAPPNPANDYAVSKLAMEYMARLWLPKLPIVITRPFNYTGVGQGEHFLPAKIVAHFRRRNEVIELGNLDVSRDFSDVREVARVYRRLVEACPVGQVINVCSGRSTSLRELLTICERISGHCLRVQVNPALMRSNEVRTLCGDPTKLRELIGASDMPLLEDTLRWMIEAD